MSAIHQKGLAAFLVSVVFLMAGTAGGFAQATGPAPVSGTIVSVSGTNIVLALPDSTQKTVVLQPKTLILRRDVAELDQIKVGDALGVTSHRSGNDLTASNINIFAQEMVANVRMDEFLMASGDWMTNGTVSGSMQGVNGDTLTMTYGKGTSTITVPEPPHSAIFHQVLLR